jgi:hypothetical protein
MSESVPMYRIDKTEMSGKIEPSVVQGEIHANKAEQGKTKLASTTEHAVQIFNGYISSRLKEKGSGGTLSRAEAAIIRQDLAKELRAKPVGGEIIKEIKAEPYYDTGKQVILPTDTGDANFKIVLFFNEQTRQYKFQLEAVNDTARQLEAN